MSSAQIPVWFTLAAPLGAAAIGIIGVVIGHLVSAWREDRREKLRAHVELERDQLKYRHEKTLWWIERRASVYEQILTFVNDCQAHIDEVWADNDNGIEIDSPEYMKITSQIDNQIRPLIERTILIAPPEVHRQIAATHEQLLTLLSCLIRQLMARSINNYDSELVKLNDDSDKMLELMQSDLGITHSR